MKTTILLNEWTEIKITESKLKLRELINSCVLEEIERWKSDNFIEVTKYNTRWNVKIDLYIKRILFFYEE